MELTGLDLGAWLTESGAVVLVYEYEHVTQVFLGFVVHPMREVRYGKDGRLVSCCFLPGESQTVEHEQKLHKWLHLDRKLGDVDAIITVNQVECMERSGEAALAPHRQYNFETQEWDAVPAAPAPHEDWVEITDPDHVLRAGIDYINENGMGWWTRQINDPLLSIVVMRHSQPSATLKFRCLRHHHPDFAPARQQDSAGAGIYDEVPPLVNTYADRTLNVSRLLRDAVDEAKAVFDDSTARIEVVPPPLREWRVLTPSGYWETVRADVVTTCNSSVDMYRNGEQVGFFVNPQAVIVCHELDLKPVAPPIDLTPLGDAIGVLRKVAKSNTCSVAVEQAVMACVERFNNLMKTMRGE